MSADKRTNTTMLLCIFHSHLKTHFAEDLRHLERSRGVHVGSDDGDAGVGLFGVAECEGPLKVHLRGTRHDLFLDMNFNHSPQHV